jgi:two-component system, chemotaxis family, sensor kinase CheA
LQRFHARWRREWRSVRASYIRLARRLQEQGAEAAAEMHTLFRFLQTNEDYLNDTNRELTQLGQLLAQDNMTLATLADNLQENVADLRMMPFESIIGGFQRMVRDLARDTHKQVQLDVVGAHVEIDKTVLDALKDPLMHLLRNSVDHGIEAPHQRELAGKIPVGHIYVVVEQRGTEIVIKVQDDGRGIDVHRIKRKAITAGLLTEAESATLDDDAAKLLIFESGFSTSDQVTAISGRGLGMDIVRDRVESLRGRISVQSVFGHGTTMMISVPVSLTRIRAIMLRVGEEDYAVPSTMVTRMETLPRSAMFTAEGREMVMLNQRPMPLVSLGALLDAPGLPHDRPELMTLLALTAADRAVAFEVEGLSSEMELVLKPLGPELANAPYVAGASLLGSGEVLLILDANDLVRRALGGTTIVRRSTSVSRSKAQRRMRVLVVDDSITTRTLEKNILEAIGFEVHVAIDGAEAWTVLGDFTPDVIISDVEMPNVNGLELTRRIKSHAHTQDIPVILLTSLGKPEQREEGLRAGADAYLIKSRFDQGELLETIQSVI